MNWKSIKNFLLILFLIVNIFLIFITIRINNSEKLSDSDLNNTITILNDNNISIDKKIIPVVASDIEIIHLTDIFYSQQYDKLNIEKTDDNSVKLVLNYQKSENTEEDSIMTCLKQNGFDVKNIKLTFSGNKYEMKYYINGFQVFNNNMTIVLKDEKMILEGVWYVYESKDTYTWQKTTPSYATNALVNLISYPERDTSKVLTVTEIEQGYYSGLDNIGKSPKIVSASPCYRLTTDAGILYYSMSEGTFIK